MSVKNIPIPLQGQDDHDSFALEPQFGTLFRNVRSNRRRVERAPGGTLLAPSPIPTGVNARVVTGVFSSPTSTGSQTYTHTLNTAPLGYIFTGTMVPDSIAADLDYAMFIGLSDGTREACKAHTALNAAATKSAVQAWDAYNNFAIYLIDANGNLILEATVTASTSSDFTLNWTTVDTVPHLVNFTLFGGTLASAFVKEWSSGTSTGNVAVTGVGFKPQLVFHLPGAPTKGIVEVGSAPSWGVQSASGQWAAGAGVIDKSSMVAERVLGTAHCIALLTGQSNLAPAITASATQVSLDADGFTVKWDVAANENRFMAALCINGFNGVKVGHFTKSTGSAPVTQKITGVGFKPEWVMMTTVDDVNTAPSPNNRWSVGVFDGATSFCWTEMAVDGLLPSRVESSARTNSSLSIIDSDSPYHEIVRGVVTSLDSSGFTLNWPINNAKASVVGFVALSGSSNALGIIRNYAELFVGATTAVEKFVMLTSASAWIYAPSTPSTGIWTVTGETYTGTTQRFSIVNTQTVAAWSQGVDNIRQWDGTSFSDLIAVGTNHAARTLLAFADRIVSVRPFYGGIDHATQIRWSVNGNVNDWLNTGSGVLEIVETSQDPLTGGFVLADRAYLAKERELIELIWTGTGSPVFGTQPRIRGMGVLAPNSIALGEQVAFWLGPDDVYMWDGSTLTAVGERIYNTIDPLIDYNALDEIQGAVWTPDSLYLLVVPPYLFIYDYRRDIWYQDDTTNFAAIGILGVGTNFTADINHSNFIVIGDTFIQTIRLDQTLTDYLGSPIDSYFTTKDYTAEELRGGITGGFQVSLWNINSLREVRFQAPAGNSVEVGVSTDRGVTWQTTTVRVNANGVGVAWFQVPFSQIRFRFRDFGTDSYEIHGSWGTDTEDSGYQYP